jgi:accessory gene regulator B
MIGFVFSLVWQSILFMALYFPLRSFAGGYHAKTQLRCYQVSVILALAVLSAIKYMPWANSLSIVLAMVAGLVIIIFAPVEDSNKPLDKIEIIIYRRRSRVILSVEICMIFIAHALGWTQVVNCITVSLAVLGVMLILGKIKNRELSKTDKVRLIKTDPSN